VTCLFGEKYKDFFMNDLLVSGDLLVDKKYEDKL
jgi:hypothetical protein